MAARPLPARQAGDVPKKDNRDSSSSDEVHQFEGIAGSQRDLIQMRAADDLPVELHHHCSRVEVQLVEQVGNGGWTGYPPGLPVYDYVQLIHASPAHGSSIANTAAAGSGAYHKARMAATP